MIAVVSWSIARRHQAIDELLAWNAEVALLSCASIPGDCNNASLHRAPEWVGSTTPLKSISVLLGKSQGSSVTLMQHVAGL